MNISITIYKPNQVPIPLYFTDMDRARAAYETLVAKDRDGDTFEIEIEDDTGQRALINRDEVSIVLRPRI
ncbi:MAG TPA: hypothetical protein VMT58_09055 [Candidatus Binataceae bacterium]|nr:hypothetical protein [Candidatus Binataceae bacterium]